MISNDLSLLDSRLQALGNVVPLSFHYNDIDFREIFKGPELEWKPYNKSKQNFNRFGLSLFSLNGETDGELDLNSLLEYNQVHGTSYDEMSFRTPTPYWDHLSDVTQPIEMLKPYLGRSHLLRLDAGGFFPPHRDLGNSFRIISFLNTNSSSCAFLVDDKKVYFDSGCFYYVNTRLNHSLFSFVDNSYILVLNVELCEGSVQLVYQNLSAT